MDDNGYRAKAQAEMGNDDESIIRDIAELSLIDYDRIRGEKAEELGVRVGILDKLVAAARNEMTAQQSAHELVSDDEPWTDPVEGAELVREIISLLRKHVIIPKGADVAIALWIVGTYAYDAFRIWAKLLISSPEKRCGKTTLLDIIRALSHRALISSSIKPSSLFRCIDKWKPTLLIDEADTFIHGDDELRGIINSGHTRSAAYVIRCVGDDHEPKQFSTWAPMVLAMIKHPQDTIRDRSITISMRRKMPGESVAKLPIDFHFYCRHLRSKLLRWALDHEAALKSASPALPPCNNDRALDNWTPIFSIAEVIGAEVYEAALKSFHLLQHHEGEDEGIGPMILADIRYLFDGRGKQYLKLSSQEIVDDLIDMDDRPWPEWRHGKPITKNSLANLLSPFGIKSKNIRIGPDTPKGYERDQFNDAFARYLHPLTQETPFQNATTPQATTGAYCSPFSKRHTGANVADEKTLKPTVGAECGVVADEIPHFSGKGIDEKEAWAVV